MKETYEMRGVIYAIGEAQTFASGYTKVEVVITNPDEDVSKYPDFVPVMFSKEDVIKFRPADGGIALFKVGDLVSIKFRLNGRKWTPTDGRPVRYFGEIHGFHVEHLAVASIDDKVKSTASNIPDPLPF